MILNCVFWTGNSDCIFTARKRSFGHGNIFTSMCHSFCPQGGGGGGQLPSVHHRSHDWVGGLHPGRVCMRGSACGGRGSASRGGGRHASYWNAFLLVVFFYIGVGEGEFNSKDNFIDTLRVSVVALTIHDCDVDQKIVGFVMYYPAQLSRSSSPLYLCECLILPNGQIMVSVAPVCLYVCLFKLWP